MSVVGVVNRATEQAEHANECTMSEGKLELIISFSLLMPTPAAFASNVCHFF